MTAAGRALSVRRLPGQYGMDDSFVVTDTNGVWVSKVYDDEGSAIIEADRLTHAPAGT
jgi:hypothetical protein